MSTLQSSTSIPLPSPIFDNLDYLENPFQKPSEAFSGCALIKGIDIDGASRDLEFSWKYLWSYNGSTATFNSYRREIERLIQWSWYIRKSSIRELRREDIEDYLDFCKHPPLSWVGLRQVPRFLDSLGLRAVNPEWRPFVCQISKRRSDADPKAFQLSPAAIRSIFSVLSSFYGYLIQEEMTEYNPVAAIRQKSKYMKTQSHKAPVRRLSNIQWDFVIETVERLANVDPNIYERSLFVMSALYAMYLRISELVADERSIPTMGDFRQDQDHQWWFHVTGKGNKDRIVAVSDSMLDALKRYRLYLGFTPLPSPGEQTPLLPKQKGRGAITSTRMVRLLVQECFDKAYERMVSEQLADEAQSLKAATVHWLRHTAISEDVKHRPREHVRDDAGHASMQTTDRYIDSDLRERHESNRNKKVNEFED